MNLIVGATGRLGGAVARMRLAEGKPVRAMGRQPERLAELKALGAEVMAGDVRDAASLARACEGVQKVVACVQALTGSGSNNPRTVDDAGNRALSRQIGGGINMDTTDQTVDMSATLKDFPMRLTPLEEVVRTQFAGQG